MVTHAACTEPPHASASTRDSAYLDLLSLIGQTTWIDDPALVNQFIPLDGSIKRRRAHWFKLWF